MPAQSFISKYGPGPQIKEITIRYEAPKNVRAFLYHLIIYTSSSLIYVRAMICRILTIFPDTNNWSDSNLKSEIQYMIEDCEWFHIYEIFQEYYRTLDAIKQAVYEEQVNNFFIQEGIGWKLVNGIIEIRGDEVFEDSVRTVVSVLETANLQTSKTEIAEAIQDLSRRPDPDITGAIQHSLACLECVMRECTGDKNSTLGGLLKKYHGHIPPPLEQAVSKIWGYASEIGRHVKEGKRIEYFEAELVVSLSAVVSSYLTQKFKPLSSDDEPPF